MTEVVYRSSFGGPLKLLPRFVQLIGYSQSYIYLLACHTLIPLQHGSHHTLLVELSCQWHRWGMVSMYLELWNKFTHLLRVGRGQDKVSTGIYSYRTSQGWQHMSAQAPATLEQVTTEEFCKDIQNQTRVY
jgi:hypothetical protein